MASVDCNKQSMTDSIVGQVFYVVLYPDRQVRAMFSEPSIANEYMKTLLPGSKWIVEEWQITAEFERGLN